MLIHLIDRLCYNSDKYQVEARILETIEIAHRVTEAASDKQASDIVLLDTRAVCSFADYFIICSGDSEKQIQAIDEEIEHKLKQAGVLPHHCEGTADSGWLVLDYGDIIVHIFSPQERDYYQLEKLWSGASLVLRMQ